MKQLPGAADHFIPNYSALNLIVTGCAKKKKNGKTKIILNTGQCLL